MTLFGLLTRMASPFHAKAKQFVTGRRNWAQDLSSKFSNNDSVVWIHCASLGEFEQGRPVIEQIKKEFPSHKILLTFFSPSGFEIRKNYPLADHVAYLPIDTSANARKFIDLVRPKLAIFVKYEFWFHFSSELKKRNIPILSISSIFRKDQIFFSTAGSFFRRVLKNFTHFFVQDFDSQKLLQSIGINNCTVAGDTRFDRVFEIVSKNDDVPVANAFKSGQRAMVVGSSWPEDIDVLIPLINENKLKFIIAPHEITEANVVGIEKALQVRSVRFSKAGAEKDLEGCSVMIIDNIGLLSKLYKYGEFAYVGGAFGKGLHNILEAACYGVPIFFGNKNFEKFREAVDLINRGGAFDVRDYPELKAKYELLNVPASFLLACDVTRQYVEENLGATNKIMTFSKKYLSQ